MATSIIMPRQGNSVESCILTKWHKSVGDSVAAGELLFSYETDKAAFDEEAKLSGVLLARYFAEGDDVPCLQDMCVIGEPGEEISAPGASDPNPAGNPAAESAEAGESPNAEMRPSAPEASAAESRAGAPLSPRAKRLAERRGVLLDGIEPTGPDGRVIERDVRDAISKGLIATPAAVAAGIQERHEGGAAGLGGRIAVAAQAAIAAPKAAEAAETRKAPEANAAFEQPGYREEPLSHMRKIIGKTMFASLCEMAQLTHTASFDASEIQALRARFKAEGEEMGLHKVTLNDIILFAVSRVLARPEHAALNANLIGGETMRYFDHVHLGVAVDTPRGLMVPTIFNADTKSLRAISAEAKALAKSCQEGTINPDLLRGGTFTVTNLGSLGIESFTPVINPPQTAILGVCAITTRVREEAGACRPYPAMGLSLTYDHRALDGTPASKFLRDVCRALERFGMTLACD